MTRIQIASTQVTRAHRSKGAMLAIAAAFIVLFAALLVGAAPQASAATASKTADRIHIMWYGCQDAIILESNGHFGIVDSGEDGDYPSGNDWRYPWRSGICTSSSRNHQKEFVSYLKSLGAKAGNVDFYIGTHPHSDHIGSAPLVIDTFKPKRVYTPEYKDSYITDSARLWDNLYVYDKLIEAAKRNKCQLIQNFSNGRNTFTMGDMKIKLLNTDGFYKKQHVNDANYLSLVTLVEANGTRALLMGDIDSGYGLEDKIAKQVGGKVDFLKLGHHGAGASTGCAASATTSFLKTLKPKAYHATYTASGMDAGTFARIGKSGGVFVSEERACRLGNKATVYSLSSKGLLIDGKTIPTFSLTSRGLAAKRDGQACSYTGFVAYKNNWYLFDGSSKSVSNQWKKVGSTWYAFDASGAMRTGWFYWKGYWYYLDAKSGAMHTGYVKDNGKWYYLDGSGRWVG